MVTMATIVTAAATSPATSTTAPKTRLDPATLKYTAVKVDVSQLTKRCKCKAFVISSQTTSRDLADMVLKKLKIDIKGHVTGTCLLTEKPGGGKLLLDPDDKVLSTVSTKSRKAITFELVPAESIDPIMLLTSLKPMPKGSQYERDVIRAGNLNNRSVATNNGIHNMTKNGMTLPGYKRIDANSNVAPSDSFLTSTPNPDSESVASTADSGFIIHYEPYISNDMDRSDMKRVRSKSFDLATENGYDKLDLSGHASDSGMVVNGNGHVTETCDSVLDGYTFRPSPQDGFQILQSKNSAWTPFSRYASDSMLKGIGHHVMPLTNSVPDVSHNDPVASKRGVQRRRSLPKIHLSQEALHEKKRSITDLFALKLQLYMNSSSKDSLTAKRKQISSTKSGGTSKDHTPSTSGGASKYSSPTKSRATSKDSTPTKSRGSPKYSTPTTSRGTPTDSTSTKSRDTHKQPNATTSREDSFRNISKESTSIKSTEDFMPQLRDIPRRSVRDDDDVSVTSQEVAEILSSASPLRPYEELEDDLTPLKSPPSHNGHKHGSTPQHVFQPLSGVLQSPDLMPNVAEQSASTSHHKKCSADVKTKGSHYKTSTSPTDPYKPHKTSHRTPTRSDRGVPLFALLTTHMLAPVMVRRNLQLSSQFLGVRLCDVTYAKCVRHVIRHWETSSRQFTMDSKLAECMMVAVGGIDRRSTIIMAGKLFRGDIVVEVNGRPTLHLSAREVMDMMSRPDMVSIVVARSRLNMERAQSP